MKAWTLRIIYFGIPLLVLAVSVLAMTTGPVLMRPRGAGDDVEARLDAVSAMALAERWDEAGAAVQALEGAWDQVRGRMRFTLASSEVEDFDMGLAELQGAVDARDQTQVRIAHRRLTALWQDLGS